MTKTVEAAIADLQAEISVAEAGLRKKKETVNTLCGVIGRAPAYPTVTSEDAAIPTTVRGDLFYGQPLASSVRSILEMRKAANQGAATIPEIYDVLTAGGYVFETRSEDIAKKSLRTSLLKNPLFHKLPNGRFGMKVWYPNVKSAKSSQPSTDSAEEEAELEEPNEAGDAASPDVNETTMEGKQAA